MKYRIKGPPPKTGFILETDAPATRFPPQSGTFFEPSREEREPQPLFEWDCFSIPLLLLFLYSLSLSLCRANLTTRGALVTSLISRENRQAYTYTRWPCAYWISSQWTRAASVQGRDGGLR